MALYDEQGDERRDFVTPRGAITLYRVASDVYVSQVSGHMTSAHADLFIEYGDRMVSKRADSIHVFHDWLEMTGYDSVCRKRLTDWSLAHLRYYTEVHIALRSRLVAMGVQVANIALRGIIQVHRDRASLQVSLRRSVAARPR